MKCFYHSDLDGKCSAAIVKQKYQQCELFSINYGQSFPLKKIENNETIYLIDYSIKPFNKMVELNKKCNLIWIDHHIDSIEDSKRWNLENIDGVRDTNYSSCELTWKYIYNSIIPYSVYLLGRFDLHELCKNDSLPFQYGMLSIDNNPYSDIWSKIFKDNTLVENLIKKGTTISDYVKKYNHEYCSSTFFESYIEGYKCLCINKYRANSLLFESRWNESLYDIMISFCRISKKRWTVSMYTTKNNIDLSLLAKKYGGGGHKNASGFQCSDLPFEI